MQAGTIQRGLNNADSVYIIVALIRNLLPEMVGQRIMVK